MVALVEEQVERAPDGRQPRDELGVRQVEEPPRARERLLPPRDPLLDRRAAGEERAGDLARAEAAQDVEDERELRLLGQPGVTAREHHPELLVADRVRGEGLVLIAVISSSSRLASVALGSDPLRAAAPDLRRSTGRPPDIYARPVGRPLPHFRGRPRGGSPSRTEAAGQRAEGRPLGASPRKPLRQGVLIDREAFARLSLARDVLCHVRGSPPSLAVLAARLGVSRFHLIRQFRAVFGTTPRQAQIEARLALAKELLALGDRSVSEVCLEVSFSSLGSFSSLFARRVGATPSEYRRRARARVQAPGSPRTERRPGCLSLMAQLPPSVSPQFPRSGGQGSRP